ncbi:transposase [Klebsiella pneumoniae]|uniref:transposase n=1 Tax=Klebsiella pneumoniae TaxID=573 RepID=UPI00265D2023|nr:transposase [Klebsiella pneumoniae]
MRRIRFTEHQIIAVLKSVEAERTVKDVCREAAISEASYYNWKAKHGGKRQVTAACDSSPGIASLELRLI